MDTDYQERESKAVDAIKKAIPPALKRDMLRDSRGLFAEVFENNEVFPNHYIASGCDSVGTKIILAEAMGIYDTVGIDCVAMSANDLATLGAVNPFLFMDCVLCQSEILDKAITGPLVQGMAQGLAMCDASSALRNSIRANFGKGETASVHELLSSTKEGYGFDIIGSMIGFIAKEKYVKRKVRVGDKIIAFPSTGLHSNGYTDARHCLLNGDFESRPQYKKLYRGKFSLHDLFDSSTIGKKLIEPTRIYVRDMAAIARDFDVVGVNNTGYGLKNFNRITGGFEFNITKPLPPQPIFGLIQKESGFTDEKMYTTFNMGMGFFGIVHAKDADDILQIAKDALIIGDVKKSSGNETITVLAHTPKKIIFKGY